MYEVKASLIYKDGKTKSLKAYYIPKGIGTTAYHKDRALKELHENVVKKIGVPVGCKIVGFKKMAYDVLIIGK